MEDLKANINSQIDEITRNADGETLERIKEYKNSSHKDSSNIFAEKNLKKLGFFQKFIRDFERDVDIDPGRLVGLSDGIFGMVMTLLVFGMALPEIKILTAGDFMSFLYSIAPTFGVTIVSFILVASFWVYHHEFIKLTSLNIPYLWLNIFYLASISFIPFSTSIIGAYSNFFLSEVIFGINIMLTLFFFMLMYIYANNRGFLQNKPSKKEKKYTYNTFLIILAITLAVNLLDFKVSNNFIYLFLLVPVISTLRDMRFRWHQK